jgi:cell fate regulator YaaT (PSP1 superfamily)
MGIVHLVQVGLMGVVGRYNAIDHRTYPRNSQVVCKTNRGLETGTVLCALGNELQGQPMETDGQLLRSMTNADRLIVQRLERYRDRAYSACGKLLKSRDATALLVDVEHLFDGKSVYFYFIGEVGPELDELIAELGETYQHKVHFRQFSKTLANGCGPNCGTGESKCASGGCSSCATTSSCRNR